MDLAFTNIRTTLNWQRRLSSDSKLDVKGGWQYNRRKQKATFFGFDAQGATVLDEHTNADATDSSWTFGGKYRLSRSDEHALGLGWDAEISQRSEDRIQRQKAPAGYPAIDLDESYDARVQRLALFCQDEWEAAKGLSIYLGMRWEGLETSSSGNVLAEVRNKSSVFSPLMQTVWKLPGMANDQVRLALSRTYKAPITRDLVPRRYVANDNTSTTPDLQGNPALRPELAWGIDAAYEHYFGKAGLVSLGVNARRIESVILQQLSFSNGKWISTPANNGKASTRGVQLEGRVSMAKLDSTLPDMDLRGSANWNWSTVEAVPGPRNRLDRQEPFVANVGFDFRARSVPVIIGGNFNYQRASESRRSVHQSVSAGTKRVLDAYGLWKASAGFQLRLSASNVLGQDYIAGSDYFDDSGIFRQLSTSPTHRTVKLTLEWKL